MKLCPKDWIHDYERCRVIKNNLTFCLKSFGGNMHYGIYWNEKILFIINLVVIILCILVSRIFEHHIALWQGFIELPCWGGGRHTYRSRIVPLPKIWFRYQDWWCYTHTCMQTKGIWKSLLLTQWAFLGRARWVTSRFENGLRSRESRPTWSFYDC